MSNLTEILQAIDEGDQQAAADLLPVVYDELRRLAKSRLSREKPGQTLQATDLVHEAYRRLIDVTDGAEAKWNSAGHFFGAAAEAMRRILIEKARRQRVGPGKHRRPIDLDNLEIGVTVPAPELIALDEALNRLEQRDVTAARLVKLRFFAGLSMPETAETLEMPLRTAERKWRFVRSWLRKELGTEL